MYTVLPLLLCSGLFFAQKHSLPQIVAAVILLDACLAAGSVSGCFSLCLPVYAKSLQVYRPPRSPARTGVLNVIAVMVLYPSRPRCQLLQQSGFTSSKHIFSHCRDLGDIVHKVRHRITRCFPCRLCLVSSNGFPSLHTP